MAATKVKLSAAVEAYFTDLGRVRASGGATGERSAYGPLANLLNAVGAALKPKVFCVGEFADQGAGHPDFGLYAAKQVQRGRPREGQIPERGGVEVKAADDDAWLTATGDQVSRYWGRYRLVLVTNTRDFVLVGEDAAGRPAKLETFRLADSADDFRRKLEKPRAFARAVGADLGEYLARALSHRAALAEPKDLAWLLASYARDGLARVEAAGDAPAMALLQTWRRGEVVHLPSSATQRTTSARRHRPRQTCAGNGWSSLHGVVASLSRGRMPVAPAAEPRPPYAASRLSSTPITSAVAPPMKRAQRSIRSTRLSK